METVEVVIRINKNTFDAINELSKFVDGNHIINGYQMKSPSTVGSMITAIAKGTVLPKGHGRLGDLDTLYEDVTNGIKAGNYEEGYEGYENINDMDDIVDAIKYAPTVIEADKAESENKK